MMFSKMFLGLSVWNFFFVFESILFFIPRRVADYWSSILFVTFSMKLFYESCRSSSYPAAPVAPNLREEPFESASPRASKKWARTSG